MESTINTKQLNLLELYNNKVSVIKSTLILIKLGQYTGNWLESSLTAILWDFIVKIIADLTVVLCGHHRNWLTFVFIFR